jgi:hypothetical protein
MAGIPWTEQEKFDATVLPWVQFQAKYPTRTYDSYEVKRRRVVANATPDPDDTRGLVAIPEQVGFTGILMGFWDLETTFSTQPRILSSSVADSFGNVVLQDHYTNPGSQWIDDSRLVVAIKQQVERYDIIVGWNSKLFDVPVLNGRLNKWRVYYEQHGFPEGLDRRDFLPLNAHMHIDLMYYATGQFNRIGRKSLESVSTFFNSPNRKTPLNPEIWDRADHGDMEAYDLIREHNVADVKVTRDTYGYLKPHVRNIHRAS